MIIGKKGSEIEKLKAEIEKFSQAEIIINILEVRKPEVDAQLVAENVAMQLERRVAFRRAMKKCVGYALKFGAKGIKISLFRKIRRCGNVAVGMVSGRSCAIAYFAGRY